MTLLRASPNDLFALAGAAAEYLGIPQAAFVEKDYWVVELLRSVMRPPKLDPINGRPCSARALLKGGTSLSKAFGIIERFSEDVDILIVHEGLGQNARENRVLRPICDRARVALGLTESDVLLAEHTTGTARNVHYLYPVQISSAVIAPMVRLEMGIRGGTLPGTIRSQVRSYISAYVESAGIDADFGELALVDVELIAPVRTLAEKLALLHHAATTAVNGDPRSLERAGRHFGDIARLLSDGSVLEALGEEGSSIQKLAIDVESWSANSGWPYTPRPADGYGMSVAFDRASAVPRSLSRAIAMRLD